MCLRRGDGLGLLDDGVALQIVEAEDVASAPAAVGLGQGCEDEDELDWIVDLARQLGNQCVEDLDDLTAHFDGVVEAEGVPDVVQTEGGSQLGGQTSQGHLRPILDQGGKVIQSGKGG